MGMGAGGGAACRRNWINWSIQTQPRVRPPEAVRWRARWNGRNKFTSGGCCEWRAEWAHLSHLRTHANTASKLRAVWVKGHHPTGHQGPPLTMDRRYKRKKRLLSPRTRHKRGAQMTFILYFRVSFLLLLLLLHPLSFLLFLFTGEEEQQKRRQKRRRKDQVNSSPPPRSPKTWLNIRKQKRGKKMENNNNNEKGRKNLSSDVECRRTRWTKGLKDFNSELTCHGQRLGRGRYPALLWQRFKRL